MKRSEFETLKTIIDQSTAIGQLLFENDWQGDIPDLLKNPSDEIRDNAELRSRLKSWTKDSLLDGENIIDLYTKVLVLANDLQNDPENEELEFHSTWNDTELMQLWIAFWEGAEEAMVEPEHWDEEQ